MRYSRTDLLQLKDQHLVFDEDYSFMDEISKQFPRIRKINDINVRGDGVYDPGTQHLDIHLEIEGSVIVGCDISGEDVIVPVNTESDEIFTFNRKEDDVNIVKSEGEFINLWPTVFQLIMMEIPFKVVKQGKIDYPKGNGWEVISEGDYQKEKSNQVDSRLAILKDYKPQDE